MNKYFLLGCTLLCLSIVFITKKTDFFQSYSQKNSHNVHAVSSKKVDELTTALKEKTITKSDNLNTDKNIEQESTIVDDVLKIRALGEQYAANAPNREMIVAQLRGLSFAELTLRKTELNEEIESKKMIERHNTGELSEDETKHFVELFINASAVNQILLEKLDERFEARRLMAEEYEKQHFERSYH